MSGDAAMLELSQVLLPVADLDASLAFYGRVLGLPLLMRDGERYATLGAGGVKVALAAPAERPPDRGAAMAFKVRSLQAVIDALAQDGGTPSEVVEGHHETSVEVRDPDGHAVLFYEPR